MKKTGPKKTRRGQRKLIKDGKRNNSTYMDMEDSPEEIKLLRDSI